MVSLQILVGFCALIALSDAFLWRLQSAGARGRLMCGSQPLARTRVKLWDNDSGPDPDDLLGSVCTDSGGNFSVSGYTREMSNIDLYLKVYTDCNDKTLYQTVEKPCQRKIKMELSDSYINDDMKVPTNWYEAGTMNMEAKHEGEERNCEIFEEPC